jgi:hypothetical protein
MDWAVVLEDRIDREGVLMLLDTRSEAESIAAELQLRGQKVIVLPYPEVDPGTSKLGQ